MTTVAVAACGVRVCWVRRSKKPASNCVAVFPIVVIVAVHAQSASFPSALELTRASPRVQLTETLIGTSRLVLPLVC